MLGVLPQEKNTTDISNIFAGDTNDFSFQFFFCCLTATVLRKDRNIMGICFYHCISYVLMLFEHTVKMSQMEIHFMLSCSGHSSVTIELMQQLCCVQLKGHNACSEFSFYNYTHRPAVLYNSWIRTPQLPRHVCDSQMNGCMACLMHWTLPHSLNMYSPS